MIRGLNHVGLSVVNLEKSIEFYGRAFGLKVLAQTDVRGERYESILRLSGASGRAAMLGGHALQIELFQFSTPAPKAVTAPRPVSDYGLSHFCVEVLDIDSEYQRLLAEGVSFHCPPLDFGGETKATYGRDIDGNVFELLQRSEAS